MSAGSACVCWETFVSSSVQSAFVNKKNLSLHFCSDVFQKHVEIFVVITIGVLLDRCWGRSGSPVCSPEVSCPEPCSQGFSLTTAFLGDTAQYSW